jgi:hypothetical protein
MVTITTATIYDPLLKKRRKRTAAEWSEMANRMNAPSVAIVMGSKPRQAISAAHHEPTGAA